MKFSFENIAKPQEVPLEDWNNWKWQIKNLFQKQKLHTKFKVGCTPYYAKLIEQHAASNLGQIVQVQEQENLQGLQEMQDPLGEQAHQAGKRIIHRYPDRVLFLVTDMCGVYCRYCTRKHFTGKKHGFLNKRDFEEDIQYIENNPGIREVILSGGDPLTLSDNIIENILERLRSIPHIEILRIATRLPVVCPMRLTPSLLKILKKYQPVFLLMHFNHPAEISKQTAEALKETADSGILMFNQTVLLNGINNHPSIIQALARRLLYLRVKPYYLFQCDPSEGSDHFRTSVENSKWIQRELWGRLSGLASSQLSLDIPGGGGKVGLVPDFLQGQEGNTWTFEGFDKKRGDYISPLEERTLQPPDLKLYEKEWLELKNQTYGS